MISVSAIDDLRGIRRCFIQLNYRIFNFKLYYFQYYVNVFPLFIFVRLKKCGVKLYNKLFMTLVCTIML